MTSIRLLSFSLLLMALSFSCEKEQYQAVEPVQEEVQEPEPYQEPPCELGQCQNRGICVEGTCDCPPGYTGKFCEFRYGSFTDSRDDKRYRWVTLRDGKKWMAESLNYGHANVISYSYDDRGSYSDRYGLLYPWTSIMEGEAQSNTNPSGVNGICPDGWHVPSSNEWATMAELYGGFKVDADNDGRAAYFALIDEGYSGLNLQLSGVRRQRWTFFPSDDDTDYYSLDQAGVYLSSTNESENLLDPGVHTFSVGEKSLKRGKSLGYDGFSCRCVED